MKRTVFALSAVVVLVCLSVSGGTVENVTTPCALAPVPRFTARHKQTGKLWWGQRFVGHLEQIEKLNGHVDLVLCGDSITHNWEYRGEEYALITNRYSVLNLGYGSDCVQHLIWRLENGELDGYQAKCIVVLIGTNGDDSPTDKAAGIRRVLDVISAKQPCAKILLLPIFPRGSGAADPRRISNDRVNEIIRGYADGEHVIWLDFTAKFMDENGDTKWIMPDRLHPNMEGHRIWREAIEPWLEKFVRAG